MHSRCSAAELVPSQSSWHLQETACNPARCVHVLQYQKLHGHTLEENRPGMRQIGIPPHGERIVAQRESICLVRRRSQVHFLVSGGGDSICRPPEFLPVRADGAELD